MTAKKKYQDIPYVVGLYRTHMGYVDQYNQTITRFPTRRTSLKWWKPIFFYFLECAIVNAWRIYNSVTNKLPQKLFRIMLAKELIADMAVKRRKLSRRKLSVPLPPPPIDEDAQTTIILKAIAELTPVPYESGRKTCRCSIDCKSKARSYCGICGMEVPICVAHAGRHAITFALKK